MKTVNLLWTGGWDSTFRLLDLILLKKRKVQTYYIIDAGRPSTGIELLTIKNIRHRLCKLYPAARELLLPTKYYAAGDIGPNHEITQSYQVLRERYGIGSQYEWLARFAYEQGIHNLEMSIAHQDGRVFRALEKFVIRRESGGDTTFEIDKKHEGTDIFRVFKDIRLPILDISKIRMVEISKAAGFNDLMELSWFCHTPRRSGAPCGRCNPCICAIEEGLAWRLPWVSRARYHLRAYAAPHLRIYFLLLSVLERHPKLYSIARKIRRTIFSVKKSVLDPEMIPETKTPNSGHATNH
jgi:7-cyano-7-deazaguanine synthase in queuosine biosynthesis